VVQSFRLIPEKNVEEVGGKKKLIFETNAIM